MAVEVRRYGFRAMASACELVLAEDDATRAGALAQQAIAEVQRIEAKYSRYREESLLSRINAAAGGEPVPCDDETLALLDHAAALWRLSEGRFDITSGVLRRAWDFRRARVPERHEVESLLPLVGFGRVEREGGTVRLPEPGMEIDFGGFGKEYAADRAAEQLAAEGVRHGYVNLAGDLRAVGPRPDGTPWRVGIRHPRQPGALLASVPLTQGGLATSGDYERFFEAGGRRFCHVLDARSGWPVEGWQSVSVLAPLAVTAGNCATLAMLAGHHALDLLESSGFDYLAVDAAGGLHRRGGRGPAP